MTSHILHRQTKTPMPEVVRGEGVFLYDKDGKRYLDGSGGAAVSCLGHGHPKVVAALHEQLDKIAFAHTAFFTNEPAEELADFLCERAPGDIGRVIFSTGGSESVEAALKLARQIHLERGEKERAHFIARRQSYHGATLGAMSVGYHAARRATYQPILNSQTVSHISPAYEYRNRAEGESEEDYGKRAAQELEDEIQRVGPEKVAAFVCETVSGSSIGAVPPPPGYLKEIRRICDDHGVLLILDEVMCGMGRTGTLFACEQDAIAPDIVTIAKGLGAGYQPIGATLVSSKAAETIIEGSGALAHGHTYMSHAAACAGALAVQHVIEDEGLLANVRDKSDKLFALLNEKFGQHPHIGDIRGRGLFIGVEFVADRETKEPFDPAENIAAKFKAAAFANGLICYPANGTADGVKGDHTLLAPPFIISDDEVALMGDLLEKTVKQVLPGA